LIPDLGLVHLPGHSDAPDFAETSLACWIRGYREMLAVFPAPPLIIAESLGAVIAMALPARAVIAVEPPLSTERLWSARLAIQMRRAEGLEISAELAAMFDQSFHWVLDQIQAPTLVLAGMETELSSPSLAAPPSVLTDEDFAAYAAHPLVEAHRVAGGHALLRQNPEGVMAAASGFMTRHGYLTRPPAD
jgi:pimeloyl-ACP methyl ester carboxylesterase